MGCQQLRLVGVLMKISRHRGPLIANQLSQLAQPSCTDVTGGHLVGSRHSNGLMGLQWVDIGPFLCDCSLTRECFKQLDATANG
jgi:hypothetical protein